MGGHCCWRFAHAFPERLAGLILMAAGGLAEPTSSAICAISLARCSGGALLLRLTASRGRLAAGLRQNVFDPSVLTAEMVEEWWQASRRPGVFDATIARLRAPFSEAAAIAGLGKIQTPTLIQWGQQDNVFPLTLGERLARQMPCARLLTYSPCRHFPMLEHPEPTARDAEAFMGGL